MAQAPIVTAQDGGLDLTFRTETGDDVARLLAIVNDPNNRNAGIWCDTDVLNAADIYAEWAAQTLIRGSDNYIVSVGVDDDGNIKTVVEGWIYDRDKFLFKSVVWDAQNISEAEWSLYIHAAVSEVVRQVKRAGVDELHVSATEGTFIRGYVEYLSQWGYNTDDYSFYMNVTSFESVSVSRGLVFDYAPSVKTEEVPENIIRNAERLDDTTWKIEN